MKHERLRSGTAHSCCWFRSDSHDRRRTGYQCTECHVRGDGSFGTTLARAACFVGSGLTHSNCPPTNPGRFTRSAINFGTSFVNNPVTNSGGTGSPTSTTSGSSWSTPASTGFRITYFPSRYAAGNLSPQRAVRHLAERAARDQPSRPHPPADDRRSVSSDRPGQAAVGRITTTIVDNRSMQLAFKVNF